MEKKYALDSKLKLYSTLALGVLAAGAANAQVNYTDVDPDFTMTGVSGTAERDSLEIDFDGDGVNDIQLQLRVYGTTPTNTQVNLNGLTSGANVLMSLVNYTYLGYALDIPSGNLIGAASPWEAVSQAVLASNFGGTTYGNLGDGLDHFVGFRFTDATSATHYGWMRVTAIDVNGTSVTLKDYAWEATADTAIAAGGGASGINNLSAVQSNIFAFNHKVVLNFNTAIDGTVRIYNALGELVLSEKIMGMRNEIAADALNNGIYMIQVETSNGNFTKKVKI